MMKRTNFLLAVACCILFVSDLCVSPIHGIQCYICESCPDPVDEHTCKPRHTLCAVAEYKSGKITRDCLSIDDKEDDEKVGTKCDEFNGDPPFRRCYCNTDLCNDNSLLKSGATTSDSGRAKGHYSIFTAVFVSAFVSVRYAY